MSEIMLRLVENESKLRERSNKLREALDVLVSANLATLEEWYAEGRDKDRERYIRKGGDPKLRELLEAVDDARLWLSIFVDERGE
jgi:50S ribosomal subunit-associated GTPase HflX